MNYFTEVNPDYKDDDFSLDNMVSVDAKSAVLIKSMKSFIEGRAKALKMDIGECQIENLHDSWGININGLRLTCDYLGPSIYHTRKVYGDSRTVDVIINAREFGGHIIWPSRNIAIGRIVDGKELSKSINTARSYCLRERLDYTLFELRLWFLDRGNEGTIYFQRVLEGNRDWFGIFGKGIDGYKRFIEFFCLQDAINMSTYEPFDFESYDGVSYERIIETKKIWADDYIPKDFNKYINGIENVLRNRTLRIIENQRYTVF